jgi:predicted nucleotidyltransferase
MKSNNLAMLMFVAESLGDILEEVVFVGGSTTELYADSSAAPEPRPTQDVDCIIEVVTYHEYHDFEKKLRAKGFTNDQSENTPLCRWIYKGTIVDVMPISENILGFTNEWYPTAIKNAIQYTLGSIQINILNVPYFFSTKLSALKSRGMADLRTSKDFEDIVYVLNNRASTIYDISTGAPEVVGYIRKTFSELIALDVFEEAVSSVLDYGEPVGTKAKIIDLIKNIVAINIVLCLIRSCAVTVLC